MGAQNPKRLAQFIDRYKQWQSIQEMSMMMMMIMKKNHKNDDTNNLSGGSVR
jgi:hypothetical protein